MNQLIENLDKLHTTEAGNFRIIRNLSLADTDDTVSRCRDIIMSPSCEIIRKGKNWYIIGEGCKITVNAHSYTIITAHKL